MVTIDCLLLLIFSLSTIDLKIKMNIDKFGHHVHKRLRLTELLDINENSLVKLENGSFDLQSSRLCRVGEPLESTDAVNKNYVDNRLSNLCSKQEVTILMESIKTDIAEKFKQFEMRFNSKDLAINKNKNKNDKVSSNKRNP